MLVVQQPFYIFHCSETSLPIEVLNHPFDYADQTLRATCQDRSDG